MGRTRIQAVALVVLFSAGIGVMAVQASPTCQRFVRTYVTVPVRNRVSKATELAWAKWRVGHPNWKPRPGVTRPKYLMSRKEALDKVEFACEVPTTPSKLDLLLTPADFGPPPVVDLTPMETTQLVFPDLIPPEVAEFSPVAGSPEFPVAAPPGGVPDTPGFFVSPNNPPVVSGRGPALPVGPIEPLEPLVPIVPTPEPASFFLMTLGMAGAWVLWIRRNRVAV
jgi:PEP-CTERM motif